MGPAPTATWRSWVVWRKTAPGSSGGAVSVGSGLQWGRELCCLTAIWSWSVSSFSCTPSSPEAILMSKFWTRPACPQTLASRSAQCHSPQSPNGSSTSPTSAAKTMTRATTRSEVRRRLWRLTNRFSGSQNTPKVIFQKGGENGFLVESTEGQGVHLWEHVPKTNAQRRRSGPSYRLTLSQRQPSSRMGGGHIGSSRPLGSSMPGWTTRSILSTQTTLRCIPMG